MSFILFDLADGGEIRREGAFRINTWNWRTIVEAISRLGIVPEKRVRKLETEWEGGELTRAEARAVAAALRERIIPTVAPDERLLLGGERTAEPDDLVIYTGDEDDRNYSTDRATLEAFAAFCDACNGFRVA